MVSLPAADRLLLLLAEAEIHIPKHRQELLWRNPLFPIRVEVLIKQDLFEKWGTRSGVTTTTNHCDMSYTKLFTSYRRVLSDDRKSRKVRSGRVSERGGNLSKGMGTATRDVNELIF